MGDDRTDLPGSGRIERPPERESAPPPSPQGASYETHTLPEGGGSGRSRWPLCLIAGIGGCGCLLVVLLAFGIIGGVGWSIFNDEEDTSPGPDNVIDEAPVNPAPSPMEQQPTADREGEHVPGPQAAIGWANNRQPEWEATIDEHSEDWRWVRLLMGPPASEWTTWVELQWNTPAGRYSLLDEGPLAQDGPEDEPVPDIYQPGEDVAREAALGYVEQPDWVARVDNHSDDWRRATVSVGPPASEFVYVVTLQWNDVGEYYDLVSIDDVDYPGME